MHNTSNEVVTEIDTGSRITRLADQIRDDGYVSYGFTEYLRYEGVKISSNGV